MSIPEPASVLGAPAGCLEKESRAGYAGPDPRPLIAGKK